MGFLDFLILIPTGICLIINLFLLIIRLRETQDETKRIIYTRKYVVPIILSVIIFTLYFTIINMGNLLLTN